MDRDRGMDRDRDRDKDRHSDTPYSDISIPYAYCTVQPCTVQWLYATTRYRRMV